MKVLICCNHSYPQQGGSENVLYHLSRGLYNQYCDECLVMSTSVKRPFVDNSVLYMPVQPNYDGFTGSIKTCKPDHVLIYGDLFLHWKNIVEKPNSIPFSKSIALVGANRTLSEPYFADLLKLHHNMFNVIVHSECYKDYEFCQEAGIPCHVIPNGVDLREFDADPQVDFREKYRIPKDGHLVLNVSNFFPGKGQEVLLDVLDKIPEVAKSIHLELVCSTVDMKEALKLEKYFKYLARTRKSCASVKVLKDIPREDVVAGMKASDLFVFPSEKEVAPLVILESMAARLPYVSFDVGNVSMLQGGIVVSDASIEEFAKAVSRVLSDKDDGLVANLVKEGRDEIEKKYNWDVVVPQYKSLL